MHGAARMAGSRGELKQWGFWVAVWFCSEV